MSPKDQAPEEVNENPAEEGIEDSEVDVQPQQGEEERTEQVTAEAEKVDPEKVAAEEAKRAAHEKARGFQKRISEILKEQIDIIKNDDLVGAFQTFHAAVIAEKDLAEYMVSDPKGWVMLLNVVDKIQSEFRLKNVLDQVIPDNGITEGDIRKELAMIEQRQMEYMMESYAKAMSLIKQLMPSGPAEAGRKAGAMGPGASVLSQILGGGGQGVQVVTIDDLEGGAVDLGDMKVPPEGEKPN